MATRSAAENRIQDPVDARTTEESLTYGAIFDEAVRAAREENRRLGIPNVQVDEEGRLTVLLPDGRVRLVTTKQRATR